MNQSTWNRLSGYLPEWDQQTWDRLFGYRHAFDDSVVAVIVSILATALIIAPLAILILDRTGRLGQVLKDELWRRYISWLVLVPLLVVPILLGAAWSLVVLTALQPAQLSGIRQGDRYLSRKADEPARCDRYPVAHIRRGRPLLPSLRLVEEPCGLILFPEGKRSRDGTLGPFKPGLGMLTAGTAVPVIPCHLSGAFDAFPAAARLPRPWKIRLKIGEPLVFDTVPNRRAGWEEIAERSRDAVGRSGTSDPKK